MAFALIAYSPFAATRAKCFRPTNGSCKLRGHDGNQRTPVLNCAVYGDEFSSRLETSGVDRTVTLVKSPADSVRELDDELPDGDTAAAAAAEARYTTPRARTAHMRTIL